MFSIKHMLGAIGLTATLIDICSGNTLPLEPCNIRLPDQRCLNRHGVPFSIRYSGPNNASMDMNGPDYDALDIFALVRFTKIPDDESIPDHEYYAYTPENIAASGVAWWYAGWTISAQKRPEWKDVGEWGLFAREFLDTRNLVCSLEDHGCGGHLQEDFIKSRYKDKRIFGRLVLFQALRMSDERNKYVAILVGDLHRYERNHQLIEYRTNLPLHNSIPCHMQQRQSQHSHTKQIQTRLTCVDCSKKLSSPLHV